MTDERYERLFRLAERFADERDALKDELEFTRRALQILVVGALDGQSHRTPVADALRNLRTALGEPEVVYSDGAQTARDATIRDEHDADIVAGLAEHGSAVHA